MLKFMKVWVDDEQSETQVKLNDWCASLFDDWLKSSDYWCGLKFNWYEVNTLKLREYDLMIHKVKHKGRREWLMID